LDTALAFGNCTAAIVSAPAYLHFDITHALLKSGISVLVEKPIAQTICQLDDLYAMARTNGVVLQAGHILRHHPAYHAVKQFVRSGSLGNPLRIVAQRLSKGKVRADEGVVESFGCHDLSLIFDLIDARLVDGRVIGSMEQPRADNNAVIQLDLEGGHSATIILSRVSPTKRQEFVVTGPKGVAIFDDTKPLGNKAEGFIYDIESHNGNYSSVMGLSFTPISLSHSTHLPLSVQVDHFLNQVHLGLVDKADERIARCVVATLEMLRNSQVRIEADQTNE
jgi:predicted dehydrogenase